MCNDNLNLVELLGNCPKGTKLYSPVYGDVILKEVDKECAFSIICTGLNGMPSLEFTSRGTYYPNPDAECVLFPSKEQRDWSKFNTFKEGDILAGKDNRAFIFKAYNINGYPIAHGGIDTCNNFIPGNWGGNYGTWTAQPIRRATPEEINNLIQKMKEAGYIWYQKTKTLVKDLPIDTLVIVSNVHDDLHLNHVIIRRYAGKGLCFNDGYSSKCNKKKVPWEFIIPLDKFTADDNGIVEFKEEDNYGTANS